MKYGKIRRMDISNGEGIRVTLFLTGCNFKCKGCFNKEYQSFEAGKLWTKELQSFFIKLGNSDQIDGYSILGGEPLQQNLFEIEDLFKSIKKETKNKTIWLWTGYTYENLDKERKRIVDTYVDVLIDGQFIEELYDGKLKFRGSSNQRIIDIKKTIENKKIIKYKMNFK